MRAQDVLLRSSVAQKHARITMCLAERRLSQPMFIFKELLERRCGIFSSLCHSVPGLHLVEALQKNNNVLISLAGEWLASLACLGNFNAAHPKE